MTSNPDIATLQALQAGVDHAAREAEKKWGVGRLPLLVSDDTRAKFIRQQRRWRQALEAAWSARTPIMSKPVLDAATAACGGMRRAWAALDAEADELGCSPIAADVWEVSLRDGTVVALVRDTAQAHHVSREERYVSVWTVAEVANVIDALGLMKAHTDTVRPIGPKVGQAKSDYSWVEKGDPFPF